MRQNALECCVVIRVQQSLTIMPQHAKKMAYTILGKTLTLKDIVPLATTASIAPRACTHTQSAPCSLLCTPKHSYTAATLRTNHFELTHALRILLRLPAPHRRNKANPHQKSNSNCPRFNWTVVLTVCASAAALRSTLGWRCFKRLSQVLVRSDSRPRIPSGSSVMQLRKRLCPCPVEVQVG